MPSSDAALSTPGEEDEDARDTWPAPPPSPSSPDASREQTLHDTLPTPPPESGITDVVVVPPLRGIQIEDGASAPRAARSTPEETEKQ